jgi:hypothetical protein
MVANLYGFIAPTIALLIACIMGVAGEVEATTTFRDSLHFVRSHDARVGFTFGGLIISPEKAAKHEYGHVLQERQLGIFYVPIIGIGSLIGALVVSSTEEYLAIWSERWATELGRQ